MARFEQANAPAQVGQSETSNYYDYLAAIAADEARGLSSASGVASDKKVNAQKVKVMLDTFDFYTQLYVDKWKNREITGTEFDQQMSTILGGILPKLDAWLSPELQDSLNDSTLNTLQAKRNELITSAKGEGGSVNSPFYAIQHKVANPDLYNDFQDPTKPNSLYRAQGQGSVSINGVQYQIDSNRYQVPKLYHWKVGTDPVTGKEVSQDVKMPNEVMQRFIIKLQDPSDPQKTMDVYYDPNNPKNPYLQLDPSNPSKAIPFDPETYHPIVKTPYLVHSTQDGAYYKIEDGKKSVVKSGDTTFQPNDFFYAKEVDSAVLKNFQDYQPPVAAPLPGPTVPPLTSGTITPSGPVYGPVNPNPQPSAMNSRVLDVSPNFLTPKNTNIGAPKSRGLIGGYGGGGSFA